MHRKAQFALLAIFYLFGIKIFIKTFVRNRTKVFFYGFKYAGNGKIVAGNGRVVAGNGRVVAGNGKVVAGNGKVVAGNGRVGNANGRVGNGNGRVGNAIKSPLSLALRLNFSADSW